MKIHTHKTHLRDAGWKVEIQGSHNIRDSTMDDALVEKYSLFNTKGEFITTMVYFQTSDALDVYYCSPFNAVINEIKWLKELWQ